MEIQESEICQQQQQVKELQQKYNDIRKAHKLEITKNNNTLTSKTKEVFRLRNHNKTLVTRIKKLKNSQKVEHSNEDFEGKILEKQEENHSLRNLNQEPEQQIKELKEDKMSQVERFERFRLITLY